jgi:hypothetical protein
MTLLKKIIRYGLKYGSIMLLSTTVLYVILPLIGALFIYLALILPWWLSLILLIIIPAIFLIGSFFAVLEWILKKIFPEREVTLDTPQKQFDFNRLHQDIRSNMK